MRAILVALIVAVTAGASLADEKPMTQTEIVQTLAERTGLERERVKSVLDELAALACEEARAGFTVPGIGKLKVVDRAARTGRNPLTGEPIHIPAKQALKFTVSKTCKDVVLGAGKTPGS
jgi:DNA-binding protein HU-beta